MESDSEEQKRTVIKHFKIIHTTYKNSREHTQGHPLSFVWGQKGEESIFFHLVLEVGHRIMLKSSYLEELKDIYIFSPDLGVWGGPGSGLLWALGVT